MATERQVQETIARCVSIAVYYHNCEMTAKMAVEFRAVAHEVKGWGSTPKDTEERILRPVEAELIARYGTEAGRRLHAEVLKGFKGFEVPVLCPSMI
jgi:hypothetical protein